MKRSLMLVNVPGTCLHFIFHLAGMSQHDSSWEPVTPLQFCSFPPPHFSGSKLSGFFNLSINGGHFSQSASWTNEDLVMLKWQLAQWLVGIKLTYPILSVSVPCRVMFPNTEEGGKKQNPSLPSDASISHKGCCFMPAFLHLFTAKVADFKCQDQIEPFPECWKLGVPNDFFTLADQTPTLTIRGGSFCSQGKDLQLLNKLQ